MITAMYARTSTDDSERNAEPQSSAWLVALLLCSLAVAGCADRPIRWRGTVDEAQYKRDNYRCTQESKTFGGGSGLLGAIAIKQAENEANRLYRMCMDAAGYREISPASRISVWTS
jgi:hypothetical protein